MELLHRLDTYYDRVPRDLVTAVDVGPFTVFGRSPGWPYYARPRPGQTAFTLADIDAVRQRQMRLGVPEEFEWIGELAPQLEDACIQSGLRVARHQLLVLDELRPAPVPAGHSVELATDRETVAATRAAVRVGFGHAGTGVGPAGAAERDREVAAGDQAAVFAAELIDRGLMVMVCGRDDTGVVAGGSIQPRGDTAEIVGIATLPAARRRGLGAAVTTRLVEHGLEHGVALCLLSAENDAVARMYQRLGFRTVGTACVAGI